MPISVTLLGATGLVGGHCLDLLLRSPEYVSVRVLARRSLDRNDFEPPAGHEASLEDGARSRVWLLRSRT